MVNKYAILFTLITLLVGNISAAQPAVKWDVAANLMNADKPSLGFAGMLSGVHNDVLIIAGGANFPNAMPWDGGKKHYADKIFILERKENQFVWNENNKITLPVPIAYAGSASTHNGVVYIGGENEKGVSSKAYLLKWNKAQQNIDIDPLPDLPIAITAPGVTAIGNHVYVVGGDEAKNSSAKFFSMDLAANHPAWKSLQDAPIALANAMAVVQNNHLYLIGGRTKTSTGISELHATTFRFNFKKDRWEKLAAIFDGQKDTPFTAGSAFAVGKNYIIAAGGDKGEVFHQIETYLSLIAKATDNGEKEKLIAKKNELVIHHQGFCNDVLVYDIQQNRWRKIGYLPVAAPVTTTAAKWKDDLFICSGEIRPGVRSPKILIGKVKP